MKISRFTETGEGLKINPPEEDQAPEQKPDDRTNQGEDGEKEDA